MCGSSFREVVVRAPFRLEERVVQIWNRDPSKFTGMVLYKFIFHPPIPKLVSVKMAEEGRGQEDLVCLSVTVCHNSVSVVQVFLRILWMLVIQEVILQGLRGIARETRRGNLGIEIVDF